MSTHQPSAGAPEDPWVAFRKELGESVLRQQQVYDETVLKLSAGGLGLAVTLARLRHTEVRWPLVVAAVALAASIAAVLSSFVTSQLESRTRIRLIDEGKRDEVRARKTTWMTQLLNYASGSLLAFAAVFFAVFVVLNI